MPQLKGNVIKACCTFYEHFFFFAFILLWTSSNFVYNATSQWYEHNDNMAYNGHGYSGLRNLHLFCYSIIIMIIIIMTSGNLGALFVPLESFFVPKCFSFILKRALWSTLLPTLPVLCQAKHFLVHSHGGYTCDTLVHWYISCQGVIHRNVNWHRR